MTTQATSERPEAPGLDVPSADGGGLVRPVEGRLLAGVAAGVAQYFDLEPTLVRLVIVLATLAGGLGVPAYLAAWFFIPDEGTGISIATDLLDHGGPGGSSRQGSWSQPAGSSQGSWSQRAGSSCQGSWSRHTGGF